MSITDFIGGGYKEMLGKRVKCERCGELFDPFWADEDSVERDNCEVCSKIIYENLLEVANQKD
jgi:hypothetical protein